MKNDKIVDVLLFSIKDEYYATEIYKIKEIIDKRPIKRVSSSLDFLRGLISLRDKPVPVIDLRIFFQLDVEEDDFRIIVMFFDDKKEKEVGFIVDKVYKLYKLNLNELKPVPDIINDYRRKYMKGIFKIDDIMYFKIDLENILLDQEREIIQSL